MGNTRPASTHWRRYLASVSDSDLALFASLESAAGMGTLPQRLTLAPLIRAVIGEVVAERSTPPDVRDRPLTRDYVDQLRHWDGPAESSLMALATLAPRNTGGLAVLRLVAAVTYDLGVADAHARMLAAEPAEPLELDAA